MDSTAMPVCQHCSGELPAGAGFCPACGTATPTALTGGEALKYEALRPDAEQQQRAALQRALGPQYQLRALLGRGGFAEVYEAFDVSLKRTVAVKTLRKDIAPSPELSQRFKREAEAIAKLRHPHIVPIYAVGGDERSAYFIMPRVDGESLADALRREPRMPAADACRIVREAAEALGAAHRAGILHRDVKPENIMLDGPERRVLVMDFGIAKSVDFATSELTGTGTVIGTPHYMSPEQASGERTLDSRSDQYSLGVVAFRMLSGELPFDGESLQSVIMKQITSPARPIRELAPDVPASLAAVIDRALAKRPDDRFASLDEFLVALRDAERDLDQPSARERITAFKDRVELMRARLPGWRHPLGIIAVAAFAAAGVLEVRALAPYAYARIADRDAAQVTAQELLAGRGIAGPFATRVEFGSDSLNFRYLRPIVGRDSIERLAGAYGGLWHWTITLRRRADGTTWHAAIGANGTVHTWSQMLADSARLPNVTPAAAESLAVAELDARGIDTSTLMRRPDSTTNRANRTDRLMRWRHAGNLISAEQDTGWFETRVRVGGDRVTGYWHGELEVPQRFRQRIDRPVGSMIVGAAILLTGFGLVGVLLWLVAGPMRRDPPNWRSGVAAAFAIVVLSLPDAVANLVPQITVSLPDAQPIVVEVLVPLLLVSSVLLGIVLVGFVCAASLSPKATSSDFLGITELAAGKLRVPELASAGAIGGIAGGLLAAAQPLVELLLPASMLETSGGGVPSALVAGTPWVEVLSAMTMASSVVLYAACCQSLAYRWTRRASVAVAVPVIAALLVGTGVNDAGTVGYIRAVLVVGVLSGVVWRYGVLAGAVTLFVSASGPEVLALLFHPSGANRSGGVLALAVLVAPFALAIVAYRRVSASQARRA